MRVCSLQDACLASALTKAALKQDAEQAWSIALRSLFVLVRLALCHSICVSDAHKPEKRILQDCWEICGRCEVWGEGRQPPAGPAWSCQAPGPAPAETMHLWVRHVSTVISTQEAAAGVLCVMQQGASVAQGAVFTVSWTSLEVPGTWPCPRRSHALVGGLFGRPAVREAACAQQLPEWICPHKC